MRRQAKIKTDLYRCVLGFCVVGTWARGVPERRPARGCFHNFFLCFFSGIVLLRVGNEGKMDSLRSRETGAGGCAYGGVV